MDTNEPGREPTDAELLNNVRRMFRCAIFLAEADERWGGTAKRTPADRSAWEDRERWLLRLVDRVKTVTPELDANISDRLRIDPADLSGQRPMPGSEVSRAEVLRMSTDTLLKAEAERLPDTPAPDEVVRLRAEVVEQSATIARQFELLKGVANVLKGQAGETELWSHADLPEMATRLSARVAELEAELAALRNGGQPVGPRPFILTPDGKERKYWAGTKDPGATFPGKEPTSE